MKVTFNIYIENLGDGSVRVNFFNSTEEAEAKASLSDERFCDDVQKKTLEFDDSGKLIK